MPFTVCCLCDDADIRIDRARWNRLAVGGMSLLRHCRLMRWVANWYTASSRRTRYHRFRKFQSPYMAIGWHQQLTIWQDGVAHMIEEIPKPSTEGPKIMVGCVLIGTFTGTVFLIVLLFVCGDIDNVINSSAGPLLQIIKDATSSNAGSICLLM